MSANSKRANATELSQQELNTVQGGLVYPYIPGKSLMQPRWLSELLREALRALGPVSSY